MNWTDLILTRRCNQRCFFCYVDSRDSVREPPLAEVRRLLGQARERAEQVILCGKEVALRSDLFDIVAYAKSLGLCVGVFSNGEAFARRGLVETLAAAGCDTVEVSFHFPDAESFARGARVPAQGFHRLLEGLANLRAFMAAHPRRSLHVATETDLFALNAGRLAEMRRILLRTLGRSGWGMRLGSLLPTPVDDIGLPQVHEPLAERRRELAAFVRSQPPGIPLDFVKLPLCLLPPEAVHRSLDVRNVHEGTLLTFNHADPAQVTVDRLSSSLSRDVLGRLSAHPYRWVCRTCGLLPLCRFERVDWSFAGFRPTRGQKPVPVPGLSASGVLSRLGPTRRACAWARGVARAARSRRFPEERLLRALGRSAPGRPELVEAWAEEAPLLAVSFRVRGRLLSLRLGAPKRPRAPEDIGAVIDYLHAVPAAGERPGRGDLAAVLAGIARRRLPRIGDWRQEPWFDPQAAELLRSAWLRFGPRIWPGLGRIGAWACCSVQLSPDLELRVGLRHPGSARARLRYRPEATAVELESGTADRVLPQDECRELLDSIAGAVDRRAPPPLVQDRLLEGPAAQLLLRNGSWREPGSR